MTLLGEDPPRVFATIETPFTKEEQQILQGELPYVRFLDVSFFWRQAEAWNTRPIRGLFKATRCETYARRQVDEALRRLADLVLERPPYPHSVAVFYETIDPDWLATHLVWILNESLLTGVPPISVEVAPRSATLAAALPRP